MRCLWHPGRAHTVQCPHTVQRTWKSVGRRAASAGRQRAQAVAARQAVDPSPPPTGSTDDDAIEEMVRPCQAAHAAAPRRSHQAPASASCQHRRRVCTRHTSSFPVCLTGATGRGGDRPACERRRAARQRPDGSRGLAETGALCLSVVQTSDPAGAVLAPTSRRTASTDPLQLLLSQVVVSIPMYHALTVSDSPLDSISVFGDTMLDEWQEVHGGTQPPASPATQKHKRVAQQTGGHGRG